MTDEEKLTAIEALLKINKDNLYNASKHINILGFHNPRVFVNDSKNMVRLVKAINQIVNGKVV